MGLGGFGFPGPEDLGGHFPRLAQVAGQDVSCVPVPFVQDFGLAFMADGLGYLSLARSGEAGRAEVEGSGPAEQPAAIFEVALERLVAGGPSALISVGIGAVRAADGKAVL